MTHIGTTRSSVAYLIEVLVKLAQQLEDEVSAWTRSTDAPTTCGSQCRPASHPRCRTSTAGRPRQRNPRR